MTDRERDEFNTRYSSTMLLRKLKTTRNIRNFVRKHEAYMETITFDAYIRDLCAHRGALPAHIIAASGIDRVFGHQIFSGVRRPSRDKVLQLAFGFELDYDGVQQLLKVARKSALHPKIKRDAVIIYMINQEMDLEYAQRMLVELSLPRLGEERHD